MEEILKKYGISKQLFLKVTQFIKLQVDQKIVYTLTDQEQIAAEILIMASEEMNVKTGEKQCNLPVVSGSALLVHGIDGRVYKPNSINEWENGGNVEKGDMLYKVELIKRY